MTIALTGANGQLGRLAIAHLKTLDLSDNIVALARSPEKVADLGVAARAFDYKDTSTLAPALEGVKTLALISSNDFDDRIGQHRNVIEAAKAAGVKRIVYTSILKADVSPMVMADDHKATEELLQASGLQTTILRNAWYTENWTDSLAGALAGGAFPGSSGDAQVSPATRADLAEALAVVLANEGHENAVYELGGDSFKLADFTDEAAAQSGKPLAFNNLSEAGYGELLQSFGLPAGFAAAIANAEALAAQGWLHDESGTLAKLLNRAPTPPKTIVSNALAA